jgi:hypothetical protein
VSTATADEWIKHNMRLSVIEPSTGLLFFFSSLPTCNRGALESLPEHAINNNNNNNNIVSLSGFLGTRYKL